MAAARRIALGQQKLLEPMELLGYKINPKGHCMGFSKVVRDFILRQKTHQLSQKIDLIKNQSSAELVSKIKAAQQDQSRIAREKQALREGKIINLSEDISEHKTNREQHLDILNLFESIKFLQHPKRYPHLFKPGQAPTTQRSKIADQLIMSNELRRNGKIETLPITTDIYKIDNLISLLKKLRNKLLSPMPINYSISMILTNGGHAITIGYDPQYKNPWIFSNATNLSLLFLETEEELAKNITLAFSSNNISCFATEISVAGNYYSDLKNRLGNFLNNKEFTSEKTKLITSNGSSWLYMAARYGDITSVKSLLNIGEISTNIKFRESPLSVACLMGQTECVEEFLKYITIDINSRTIKLSYTPLMQAAKRGHSLIVHKLLEAGAYINLIGSDDKSALYLAVQHNHIETVKELLKHGANSHDYEKNTLVELAKKKNNSTMVQMLIIAEKITNTINLTSLTNSHVNALRKKSIKKLYQLMQIHFDGTDQINYDAKRLSEFKKLDNLIIDLLDIISDYNPKNTKRQISLINLRKGIESAYDEYTNKSASIDTIISTLKQLAQQISEDAKSSHLNEQTVIGKLFSTKSRLNSRIESIINRHSVNDNEFTNIKKSA